MGTTEKVSIQFMCSTNHTFPQMQDDPKKEGPKRRVGLISYDGERFVVCQVEDSQIAIDIKYLKCESDYLGLRLDSPMVKDVLESLPRTEKSLQAPTRLNDDELQEFISDFLKGRIFCSDQIAVKGDIGMVFLPIAFGAFTRVPYEYIEQMGIIFEYIEKAGNKTINGMPVFMSMQILHKEDWKIAKAAIMEEEKRLHPKIVIG